MTNGILEMRDFKITTPAQDEPVDEDISPYLFNGKTFLFALVGSAVGSLLGAWLVLTFFDPVYDWFTRDTTPVIQNDMTYKPSDYTGPGAPGPVGPPGRNETN